jgi:CBS domain-containing protein
MLHSFECMLKNIIRLELFSVKPEDHVSEVVRIMKNRNIGSVLVCDDLKKPLGIITDRDLVLRCLGEEKDFRHCTARDMMTPSPRTVRDSDGIYDCINAMHEAQVRRIPVVDPQGKALGIISFGDLLNILSKEFSNLVENTTHPLESKKEPKKAAVA